MNKYKGENAGLPFWLVLNPKGEVLADSLIRKEIIWVAHLQQKKLPVLQRN
jgi:hypothetical protein